MATATNIFATIQAEVQARANQRNTELLARVMHGLVHERVKEINHVIGRTHSLEKLQGLQGSSDYAEALRQYVVAKRLLGLKRKGVNISLDCATDAECGELLQRIRVAAEDVRQKRIAALALRNESFRSLAWDENRREEARFLAKSLSRCGVKYVDGSHCTQTRPHFGISHYNGKVFWVDAQWTRPDGTSKGFA